MGRRLLFLGTVWAYTLGGVALGYSADLAAMAGLLDFPSGIMDVPAIYQQQDAAIRGPFAPTARADPTFGTIPKFTYTLPMRPLTRPESENVQDRRYMTSSNNPFMKAANHFSMTRGYYINPEEVARMVAIQKANRDFEEYVRKQKEAQTH